MVLTLLKNFIFITILRKSRIRARRKKDRRSFGVVRGLRVRKKMPEYYKENG